MSEAEMVKAAHKAEEIGLFTLCPWRESVFTPAASDDGPVSQLPLRRTKTPMNATKIGPHLPMSRGNPLFLQGVHWTIGLDSRGELSYPALSLSAVPSVPTRRRHRLMCLRNGTCRISLGIIIAIFAFCNLQHLSLQSPPTVSPHIIEWSDVFELESISCEISGIRIASHTSCWRRCYEGYQPLYQLRAWYVRGYPQQHASPHAHHALLRFDNSQPHRLVGWPRHSLQFHLL